MVLEFLVNIMTISKEKLEISTVNAVIGMILGIGAIFAIFYNVQAATAKSINDVSERVIVVETKNQQYDKDIADIKEKVQEVPTLVRMVKHAYPNY